MSIEQKITRNAIKLYQEMKEDNGMEDLIQFSNYQPKPPHVRPAFYAFMYEGMKLICANYGYNLLLHGSMSRDLDLVAVPWAPHLGGVPEMVLKLALFTGGTLVEQSEEEMNCFPHGRQSWIININRGGAWSNYQDGQWYIDLSVFPPTGRRQ